MQGYVKILGIAGSLRRGSYNRAAQQMAPASMRLEAFENLGKIPPWVKQSQQVVIA